MYAKEGSTNFPRPYNVCSALLKKDVQLVKSKMVKLIALSVQQVEKLICKLAPVNVEKDIFRSMETVNPAKVLVPSASGLLRTVLRVQILIQCFILKFPYQFNIFLNFFFIP